MDKTHNFGSFIAEFEKIIGHLYSLFQHVGPAAFSVSGWSPVQPSFGTWALCLMRYPSEERPYSCDAWEASCLWKAEMLQSEKIRSSIVILQRRAWIISKLFTTNLWPSTSFIKISELEKWHRSTSFRNSPFPNLYFLLGKVLMNEWMNELMNSRIG